MNDEVRDFQTDVIERSAQAPVLVDFWAPWCGPCKMLAPVLERLAAEAGGRWTLAKVNTDEHPELAGEHDIRGIPCVKLFHQRKEVGQFVGVRPEPEIRRWLKSTLPSLHAVTLEQSQNLLAEGRAADAAPLLEAVVDAEPDNEQARVLLAEAQLALQPAQVEAILRPVGVESALAEKAEGLRTLAKFARLADQPERLADQPERLPEAAVRARYLAGARAIREGDHAAALEAFIEVIERDRDYDDGGAREACKAIFQFLGIRHRIAERYHRAFTSALYR